MRTIVFYQSDRDLDHSMGKMTEEEYQKLLPYKEAIEDNIGVIPEDIEILVWETINNRCKSILAEDLPQNADIWINVC